MAITQSTYTEGPPQVDGRRYVQERHTDDNGKTYEFEWLGKQDADLVLSARAEKISDLLDRRAAAEAVISGTKLPLTKLKFRRLFTKTEREDIDEFNEKFESNANLTNRQKKQVRTALREFDHTEHISRPFDPDVLAMLDLYEAMTLVTPERVVEIKAAGNG